MQLTKGKGMPEKVVRSEQIKTARNQGHGEESRFYSKGNGKHVEVSILQK